jgi:cytochrome c556
MISISSVRARAAITAILLLFGATVTSADTPPPEHRELSRETREKMAALHEQMAACLRSEKPFPECHSAMIKSCQEQLGSDGCPMMTGMGHGSDTRHRMQPMGESAKPAEK